MENEKYGKDDETSYSKVMEEFLYAFDYKKRWIDAAKEDFEFALGKQWDDNDVEKLKEQGVRALTINKVRPNILLLTGIEKQNRSDMKAFPEGGEDSISAEIATLLLKNTYKVSDADYTISEQFEDGVQCGECFIEPYLDYTNSLLYGEMMFRKHDYNSIYPDPDAKKYDLSDAKYVYKVSFALTKDQLLQLFPDREKEIESNGSGSMFHMGIGGDIRDQLGVHIQHKDYETRAGLINSVREEPVWDLLERYYKKYVPKYYVVDMKLGTTKETDDVEEAMNYYRTTYNMDVQTPEQANGQHPNVKIFKKFIPQVWVCSVISGMDDVLEHKIAWTYPKWKGYPFIPFYAYRSTVTLDDKSRHLKVQGVVRGIKDLNRELNKRRTQELRHLNQSANSGWLNEQDAWVDPDKVENFGSAPGVRLEYKSGKQMPQRIVPTPLSQGHAQLAQENYQDMKEASGINTDLLSMQEGGQASGRAISLRQRQGMVMVQGLFDNLAMTKRMIGKFILSQLSEIYDINRAARVIGSSFIQENFMRPVTRQVQDQQTGQMVSVPVPNPDGSPAMEIDQEKFVRTVNQVLNDAEFGKYDIFIGENIHSETIKYANYSMLQDMRAQGIPIPPDIIIDESMLSQASKNKIKRSIEQANVAAMQAPLRK